MNYTLFVSHSIDDRLFADAIRGAVAPLGVNTYMFERDPQPGSNLSKKLLKRITESDAFVALLTASGAKSPTVAGEIGAATQAGKPIIPVIERGVDLNRFAFLQGLEWVEFDREDPPITLSTLSTRVSSMKLSAEQTFWRTLVVLGGLVALIVGSE